MTLEELQKIIGQQNSGLQLKMPVRETNPNYNYDYLIQPEPSYDPKYMNNIHTNEKFQELLKE